MLTLKKAQPSRTTRGHSLQDAFLDTLREDRVPVTIYLVNGIKLLGKIDSFDQFSVMLRNSTSQVVYKRAISTIEPGRDVRLTRADAPKRPVTSPRE